MPNTTAPPRRKTKQGERSPDLGPIEPHTLYPLAEFQLRTGWGRHAVRQARATGLKVHYAANRAYVLGRDFIEYVTGGESRPALNPEEQTDGGRP